MVRLAANAAGRVHGDGKSAGGLEHVLFSHILGTIIPTDFHIFSMGLMSHQPDSVLTGESCIGTKVWISSDGLFFGGMDQRRELGRYETLGTCSQQSPSSGTRSGKSRFSMSDFFETLLIFDPCAPWCWHISQHLPEQNHPVM